MASTIANKETVLRWLNAINRRDLAGLLACYTEDAVIHLDLPLMLGGSFSKQESMQYAVAMWEVFPTGLELSIDEVVAEGDVVTVHARSDGFHITGRRYQNWHQFVMVFCDGLIKELSSHKDLELARQVLFTGAA